MTDATVNDVLRVASADPRRAEEFANAAATATGRHVEVVETAGADLRDALRAGACEVALHDLADLPVDSDAPVLAVIPPRGDPRDAVITRDGVPLHELAAGSVVGAATRRRMAQVHRRNPRAEVREVDADVDGLLQAVIDGGLDAAVVAVADLSADDPRGLWFETLGLAEWPGSAGQGALGAEVRADAGGTLATALSSLHDVPTRIAVTTERAALQALDPGDAPVAVHAEVHGKTLRVRAIAYSVDGSQRVGAEATELLESTESLASGYIRSQGSGDGADAADGDDPIAQAVQAGSLVAHRLLERGAAELFTREFRL